MTKPLVSYSQNREDLILHVILSNVKKGFYVDVGANYPEQDSVTKFFYDRGWRGINIEPIPELYQLLKAARPRDLNLNIGVSDKSGILKLRQYSNGLNGWSTFSNEIKDLRGEIEHKDYDVPVETLETVFKKNNITEIDFLKIDVEGLEYKVLAGNNWDMYKPKVVIVENTPGEWMQLLKKKHYSNIFFDGLNQYFVRSDLTEEYNVQNYGILFEKGTITARDKFMLEQLKSEIVQSKKDYRLLKDRLDTLVANPEHFVGGKVLLASLLRKIRLKLWHKLK